MEKVGSPKLLITGVTGYLGSWTTLKALESGKYEVYGTIRDHTDTKQVDEVKTALGDKGSDLKFRTLDLDKEETADAAVEGMDYVIHIAAPFLMENPSYEKTLIDPAVNGAKAVLKAASKHKVKKVIVTAAATNLLDYSEDGKIVNEESWNELTDDKLAHIKSKILSEKAVWEFHSNKSEDDKLEVCTILPGYMTGPVLKKSDSGSFKIVSSVMTGKLFSIAQIYFPWVDVRDAADAHLAAVEKGKDGSRYPIVEGSYYYPEMGDILSEEFSQMGYPVSTGEMCLATMWTASFFSGEISYYYSTWGYKCTVKSDKAVEEFDLQFKDYKQSLKDMGYSLIDHGVIDDLRSKADQDKNSERGEPENAEEKVADKAAGKVADKAVEKVEDKEADKTK